MYLEAAEPGHRRAHGAVTGLFVAAMVAGLVAPGRAQGSLPSFKVHLEETAAYRVGFEDLAAAGLGRPLPSGGLGLSRAGKPVALWLQDGGDGVFGPGDWFEFVGERLAGEYSYASEYSRYNVYLLRFDHERPARMSSDPELRAPAKSRPRGASHTYRRDVHLEEDLLILRLPPRNGQPEELWYWAKLVHSHREPWVQTLDLDDLSTTGGGTVDLRIHLRGWSKPRTKVDPELEDHQVDVSLNGTALASAQWSGTQPYLLEVAGLAADRFVAGANSLALRVPARPGGEGGRHLVDVVMLNWIELAYPRTDWVGEGQQHFVLTASPQSAIAHLASDRDGSRELLVYGRDAGNRRTTESLYRRKRKGRVVSSFVPAPGESSFIVTRPAHLKTPETIVQDRPSQLADGGNRADYIMIAHRRLLAAIEPLAEFHRSRGLEVAVVDVEDVYDEFSHGVVDPRALRDFLHHAYHRWRRPAPRFVLLVGDASWDAKNSVVRDANYADWTYRPNESERFLKNRSTPYTRHADLNHRHLVPTWNTSTHQGHSASDNFFVAVDGEDAAPDMAVGRFPVTTPEEVSHIVDKTLRYASRPEVGPWRRNVLFITNETSAFKRRSDRVVRSASRRGLAAERIYPESSEASNEHHTARLVESLDRGQLFVHFFGHGGRYIWRTGPPDPAKNHDLFTLDHLDQLAPTEKLPVVLSLTCYSAPFDHPSADSIGEKLLRLPDRGAVAVLAASWRNSPSARWGEVLLEELTRPGVTVGEAVQGAKHRIPDRLFVETYNLLGDPAVPVALPRAEIALDLTHRGDGTPRLVGEVKVTSFSGRLLIDVVDESGNLLHETERELAGPTFTVDLGPGPAVAATIRAYAWSESGGVDAAGVLALPRIPGDG